MPPRPVILARDTRRPVVVPYTREHTDILQPAMFWALRAGQLRAIGAEVDFALQLRGVGPLADRYDDGRSAWRSLAWAIALVTASVLLLSEAGSTR